MKHRGSIQLPHDEMSLNLSTNEEFLMSNGARWYRWRPTRIGGIAGTMVIAGLVLTQAVSWWFLLLAAAGIFGPGLLRELGLLRDKDEFERRAAMRAGYHAYLVTGATMFVIYAFSRSGHSIDMPEELSGFYLALLTFAWTFSSLFTYWGPRRSAFSILLLFGTAWAVFNIWSNLFDPVAMLMQLLVTTVPFFALAFTSRRWPRVTGLVLVTVSVALLYYYFSGFPNLRLLVKGMTAVLFVGPLLTSGFALMGPHDEAPQTNTA